VNVSVENSKQSWGGMAVSWNEEENGELRWNE